MTSIELVDNCRFLLHDAARHSDTGEFFYATTTIERALTDALAEMLRQLILEKPRRAKIVTSSVIAFATPAWSGGAEVRSAPLPANFFMLECGSLGSAYVPAIRTEMGETMAGITLRKLYARNGKLYGPEADTVCYFRRPVTIKLASAQLPDFSDAVYNCAKMLACRNVVIQESKGASHRWQFFDNDYKMQMEAML